MEELDLDFGLEIEPLTLRELAVTATAANPNIWNKHLHDIKQQLMGVTKNEYLFIGGREILRAEFKAKFMQVHSLESNLEYLPKGPATAIKFKLLELCDQAFDWIYYLTKNLKLNSSYADKIYFTSKGVIDVSRIFRSYWTEIRGITPEGWFFQKFHPLHCLACFFDFEYFASHFQADVINEIASAFPGLKIDNNFDLSRIMSILIYCYNAYLVDGTDIELIESKLTPIKLLNRIERQLNETNLTAIVMLEICKNLGFWKPFIFFYNQLDPIQKQNYLEMILENKYWKESAFDIVIFLLKKMNSFQRSEFISRNFLFLFSHFLKKESYQKLCIPLVRRYLHSSLYYGCRVFTELIMIFRENKKFGLESGYHIQQVFQCVMEKIPKGLKITIFSVDISFLLRDIYDLFSIPVLRMLFDDQDLEEHKVHMINRGKNQFKSMIMDENYEELNTFAVEVLNSQKLYDIIDKSFTYDLESWMMNHNFHYLENYLKWKYGDSGKEFKIQAYPLWCSLVTKMLPDIEKLLEWCFDKTPTVKTCNDDRELMLLKEFCRELIYNIWLRSYSPVFRSNYDLNNTTKSINLSNEILILTFISDEEVEKFKKTELVTDESCVRFFCESALKNYDDGYNARDYRFEVIDEFFEFCKLPTGKIEEIKKLIADDIEEWIEKYGTSVEVVGPLLDWVYGERAENREMLINCFKNMDTVMTYYERKKK